VENPNTMITRFFGMYRVKLYHLRRNVKFVIMNSVYFTDKYLQSFYDLKGSVVGRDAKPGQTVKKDNDLRRGLPEDALSLSPPVRSRVRKQLEDDCAFLQAMGVMDYSMLVGVHHVPHTDDPSIATAGFKGSRGASRNRTKSIGQHVDESHDNSMNDQQDGSFSGGLGGGETASTSPKPDAPGHRRTHSDTANANAFFLEELDEDDSSYLAGSERSPHKPSDAPRHAESERKKQVTIERLYWPFHRMYDLHGHRRMEPVECPMCKCKPCDCHGKEDALVLQGYKIPNFVPPLSDRKDGGLEMDTSGRQLPMVFKGPKGAQHQLYRRKIFYMGVIDVLQEYTSRKALEAQYRIIQTQGKPEASCVPPPDYADRFMGFFDEFTLPLSSKKNSLQEGVELSERGEVLADHDEGDRTATHS
jgi:Phosphatidylinositol-4-phosphate 5-Kinase